MISPATLEQELEENAAAMLEVPLRCMGVIQLLFLMGHLSLIGVWLSEDQNTSNIETQVQKISDYIPKFY